MQGIAQIFKGSPGMVWYDMVWYSPTQTELKWSWSKFRSPIYENTTKFIYDILSLYRYRIAVGLLDGYIFQVTA